MIPVIGQKCPVSMVRDEFQLLRDFALIKEIGSGSTSCVWTAMCTRSLTQVAVKMYNKQLLTPLNKRQVCNNSYEWCFCPITVTHVCLSLTGGAGDSNSFKHPASKHC